jgi:hypothetical protein
MSNAALVTEKEPYISDPRKKEKMSNVPLAMVPGK